MRVRAWSGEREAGQRPDRAPELDALTLHRAQRGDPSACRTLLARHRGPVGALLRRMLVPAGLDSLTEDLAQEIFLRVFRALPAFDPRGPATLSTWILRIASRLAINELKRSRPQTLSLPASPQLPARDAADEQQRRAAIAEAIVQAVAALPPEHRAAFVLREYHALDYLEIATCLELDLGTVKSRLHRARASLRKRLEDVRDV